MPHLPSLKALRALDAAVRHRSFTRAGEELGLTHGAISQQIRSLENLVGHQLFIRRGNDMDPTPAATDLARSVARGLELLTGSFAAFGAGAVRKRIALGMPQDFAVAWMIPRLGGFTTRFPALDIHLRTGPTFDDPGTGAIDLAIRQGRGPWPGFWTDRLFPDPIFAVAAPGFNQGRLPLRPEDLEGLPLLRRAGLPWSPWFAAAGIDLPEPAAGAVFADSLPLLAAAAAGQGIALTHRLAATPDLAAGRLIRLFEVEIDDGRAWHLLSRPRDHAAQTLMAVRTRLLEEAAASWRARTTAT